jgi:hypothetical protein
MSWSCGKKCKCTQSCRGSVELGNLTEIQYSKYLVMSDYFMRQKVLNESSLDALTGGGVSKKPVKAKIKMTIN